MSLIELIRARFERAAAYRYVWRRPALLHPVIGATEIARAEHCLGFRLPPLLASAYCEIGNGGFGPGYGLLPLAVDDARSNVETVVGLL